MASKRRSARKLDDLPGLFDAIDYNGGREESAAPAADSRRDSSHDAQPLPGDESIDPAALAKPRILQFISFGSGSSGNSLYIGVQGEGGILVDAGIDPDRVTRGLQASGLTFDDVKAIFLTHDHGDHVRYTYSLVRRNKIPVYCTPRTLNGILRRHSISSRIKESHKPIFKEFEYTIGPLTIIPFEVSHDGTDNVGFSIVAGTKHFVIATDTGYITDRADFYIRQANFLMIEANYDATMLRNGTYAEYLKARIFSKIGHMDNAETGSYLAEIWTPALTDIFLCHLSKDNNTPAIALATVSGALTGRGITVGDASGSVEARQCSVQLSVLPRFDASPLHMLRL